MIFILFEIESNKETEKSKNDKNAFMIQEYTIQVIFEKPHILKNLRITIENKVELIENLKTHCIIYIVWELFLMQP